MLVKLPHWHLLLTLGMVCFPWVLRVYCGLGTNLLQRDILPLLLLVLFITRTPLLPGQQLL